MTEIKVKKFDLFNPSKVYSRNSRILQYTPETPVSPKVSESSANSNQPVFQSVLILQRNSSSKIGTSHLFFSEVLANL